MDENQTEIVDPEAVSAEVVEGQAAEVAPESEGTGRDGSALKPDNEEAKAKRRSFEERINKVTRRMHEERERADAVTRQYNALLQEVQSKPLQREAFRDDESFAAAVDRQRVRLNVLEVQAGDRGG